MSFYEKVPSYLLGPHQLIMTVVFAAFFSLVYSMCLVPFLQNVWFCLSDSPAFFLTVAFFALSIAIIVFSKRQMCRMRFDADFCFGQYILWNFGEIVSISLLYSFFASVGDDYGIITVEYQGFRRDFFASLLHSSIALGVPYVLSGQYFAISEKDNTIRLMNMSSVVGDLRNDPGEDKRITLFDNSGILKFSSTISNLYYFESDDNYIRVWYVDGSGELKQYMLRCRLKTIEESFAGSDLVRCHRKYIVNMSKVQVLKAEKEGYFIDLGIDSLEPIPVSKTYEDVVLSRFNSR